MQLSSKNLVFWHLGLFLFFSICIHTPLRAQEKEDFSSLMMTGEGQVLQIIDPLHIRLNDGRIIKLSGIDIPTYDLHKSGEYALYAFGYLKFLENKTVKIYQSKKKEEQKNAFGHINAHLVEKNSQKWVQGGLLEEGFALLRPTAENADIAQNLIEKENLARENKKAIWQENKMPDAYYKKIILAQNASQALHRWEIIEGDVISSAMDGNLTYLNLTIQNKNNFQIRISPAVRKKMGISGVNPLTLSGKRVRARGYIDQDKKSTFIMLNDPVWLEILETQ